MFQSILEFSDKNVNMMFSYSNGSVRLVVFEGDNKTPVVILPLKKTFEQLMIIFGKYGAILKNKKEETRFPITISDFIKEQKQYKIVGVLYLCRNANDTFSLVVKNSNFKHEFVFTINSYISLGGDALSEAEKSEIAFEAFLKKVDNAISLFTSLKAIEGVVKTATNGEAPKPQGGYGGGGNRSYGGGGGKPPYQKNNYNNNRQQDKSLLDDEF